MDQQAIPPKVSILESLGESSKIRQPMQQEDTGKERDYVNVQHASPLSPLDIRVGKPGIRATIPVACPGYRRCRWRPAS